MKRLKNRNIFLLLTIILSLGITLGAVYFMYQYRDSRENKLKTGMISLNFTENSEVINLSSDVPMLDDLGLKSSPYEFTITNTSKVPINVDIKVDVDNTTNIPLSAVRYGIYIDDKLVKKDYIHDNLILYTYEELLRDESINCKIKFWVDYYYDRPNQEFTGKIKVEGRSNDKLYNGVTVTFDPNGGVVDINSKEVGIGETYGKLPTPVRDGYTFMGWNGKNLFKWKLNISGAYGLTVRYDEQTDIMHISGTVENTNLYAFRFCESYTDNWKENIKFQMYGAELQGADVKSIRLSDQWYDGKLAIDVILEKDKQYDLQFKIMAYLDNKPTEYEPYYITSKTKVVQKGNHTLKAIWKKNS